MLLPMTKYTIEAHKESLKYEDLQVPAREMLGNSIQSLDPKTQKLILGKFDLHVILRR